MTDTNQVQRWGNGEHIFDRTQTWWEPGQAMVEYWKRCQALLQWGKITAQAQDDFSATNTEGKATLKYIHRNSEKADIYFVANTAREAGSATCIFNISGMQPELWDPCYCIDAKSLAI
jgi:hypothetical protein